MMILRARLAACQQGPFAEPANARAHAYISAASAALRERAEGRRARGVLGTNQV